MAETAVIGDRFEIDLGQRLTAFDSPHAEAFNVRDRQNSQSLVIALVCQAKMPWRGTLAGHLMASPLPGMLRLHASGPVSLPDQSAKRQAFIFEKPLGRLPLDRSLAEEYVRQEILPPILDALQGLHTQSLVHRAIRPANLFFTGRDRKHVVLGECVSTPPGFDQPSNFEPVERAGAAVFGRGEGTPACDLYALGTTLAFFVGGGLNTAIADSAARLIERFEKGSYETLAAHISCSEVMHDLLRGLMRDAPESRWTIQDVRNWCLGQHEKAAVSVKLSDSIRPYPIGTFAVYQPRSIIYLLNRDLDLARQTLKQGRLARWLRHSLNKLDLADTVDAVIGSPEDLRAGRREIDDETIGHLASVLDSDGPVTYRGLSIMMDGFGSALAVAAMGGMGDTIKAIKQMLTLGLPAGHARSIRNKLGKSTDRTEESRFVGFGKMANSEALESGLARCLYDLNPDVPCLSPLVRDELPASPIRLLEVLEKIATDTASSASESLLDHHSYAFLAARLPNKDLEWAKAMAARLSFAHLSNAIGDLARLAAAQNADLTRSFPNLSRYMAGKVKPVVAIYHNPGRKKRMIEAIEAVAEKGNLNALLRAIANEKELRADGDEYRRALGHYRALGNFVLALNNEFMRRHKIGLNLGQRLSVAMASCVLVGVCLWTVFGSLS